MLFGLIVFQIIYPVNIYSYFSQSSLDATWRVQQQPFFFFYCCLVSVALASPAAVIVTAPVAAERDMGMSIPIPLAAAAF